MSVTVVPIPKFSLRLTKQCHGLHYLKSSDFLHNLLTFEFERELHAKKRASGAISRVRACTVNNLKNLCDNT